MRVNPDAVLFKADKGTSKTFQLRIVRKLTVTKEFSSGEVPVPIWESMQPTRKGAAARFWEDTRRVARRLPGKADHYPRPLSTVFLHQQVG